MQAKPSPRLSIVILTWNSLAYCRACLGSLRAAGPLGDPTTEVIVIDNGSQDETAEIVAEEFPDVRLVCNKSNRGVAPARNQGLELARGDLILLLDVDTIVPAGGVDSLIEVMEREPDVGVVGPKLTDAIGRLQYTCRRFPTLPGKLARRLPGALFARWRDEEEYRHWDHGTRRDVDYVIGACQLIRRAVIEDIGPLDGRIFYGTEDVDFCLRARLNGWRVVYEPAAAIVHAERRITRRILSPLAVKHMRSVAYYFLKHRYLFSRRGLYAKMPALPTGAV